MQPTLPRHCDSLIMLVLLHLDELPEVPVEGREPGLHWLRVTPAGDWVTAGRWLLVTPVGVWVPKGHCCEGVLPGKNKESMRQMQAGSG